MDGLSTDPDTNLVARVTRVDKRACGVLLADEALSPATARWSPRLSRAADEDPAATPAAGDWVLLAPGDQDGGAWVLTEVLPRRTAVERLGVSGTSHTQVLAANADVVAVVAGMVPDLDLGRVERMLALAWSSGARPVVVLTKADLHPDPGAAISLVAASAAGCDLLAVSAPLDEGLDPLRAWLAEGATIALVGASGVGKSTLLNALLGDDVMATRTLGNEGKGRHTTVTRELHLAPGGGAVLDTPGLRSVGLSADTGLDDVFADVIDLADRCRFNDCAHTVEPGCAVLEAVETGALPRRRLDSWRALQREAAFQARRADARLQAAWTSERKARTRAYRARPTHPQGW
ncbi:ribosome small subunit-dependent GTPase A [Isoptericola sp. b490]|uniref:ribosome small subunit-dependent GTPase A n=1 Tax=Actinotalea lenta TaxID=3064654 RepID=UPI00271445AE|nr:ribosome small subunit-dependent GTPase A [Isoptericola sp. b490]MDO8120224.1 ribosome small subunit-dependent GTPase A [Isoptericola sp. b490]